jgi:hypothetical protein
VGVAPPPQLKQLSAVVVDLIWMSWQLWSLVGRALSARIAQVYQADWLPLRMCVCENSSGRGSLLTMIVL